MFNADDARVYEQEKSVTEEIQPAALQWAIQGPKYGYYLDLVHKGHQLSKDQVCDIYNNMNRLINGKAAAITLYLICLKLLTEESSNKGEN